MLINSMLLTDFYKTIHIGVYPQNIIKLVSYWIPRQSRIENINEIVMFGLQAFIKKYLIQHFNEHFFNKPLDTIIKEYKRYMLSDKNISHIINLHKLNYLPIQIKALKEGMIVPIGTPMIEITNTLDKYAWLVNYLESLISTCVWHPMTTATIALNFRKLVNKHYYITVDDNKLCNAHMAMGDFSYRGQTSPESGEASSAAFLTSFSKTATIPAIVYLENYYNCDITNELIGTGTASTEHSVMCSYDNEEDAYEKILNEYTNENISIVCDSYNYWNILTNVLPKFKESILSGNRTVFIRGDSGNPVHIICGDDNATDINIKKGTVEILWDLFGGVVNTQGYKVLDKHIRAIYGDAITYNTAEQIYQKLEEKGFSVENVALGVGSYSLQYVTRDTFGFAMKATYIEVFEDGQIKRKKIFKNPITANTTTVKKSPKGMCVVKNLQSMYHKDEIFFIEDQDSISVKQYDNVNILECVFRNGKIYREQTLSNIRNILHKGRFS